MAATPMMQQYADAKASCPGALLLFRMGDFYELFHDDAKTAARILGLSLTSREKGENATPMAGFPYHQLESYLAKLIATGLRVAICDQVEDPRQAKGSRPAKEIVKREVTRVVSRGTLTDDALLNPRSNNYLAAVCGGAAAGLAWVELSTGRFFAMTLAPDRLADELARLECAECLLAEDADDLAGDRLLITRRPARSFAAKPAEAALAKHFEVAHLEGFGFDRNDGPAIGAAGAILDYLAETQKASLAHINRLERYESTCTLQIDEATRRSLELSRTLRDGERTGSLLGVIDRTVTHMGSRQLGDWLASPLCDRQAIERRLDAVGELVGSATLTTAIRDALRMAYDLARLLTRVSTGRASPRDLSFVGRTLRGLPALKAKLTARSSLRLIELESALDLCPELRTQLESALAEDCPLSSRDGGFVLSGFNSDLDALRDLAAGGKQWIAQYQAEEAKRSGIASLKVGYNKVFGYYIEAGNSHSAKIPPNYIRKQTVKNAERYITPELKEYEEKVLTADERAKELEYELFGRLRDAVNACSKRLMGVAGALAELDALAALAELARSRTYCRPEILDEPILEIEEGRHPVLDLLLADGSFVPNDTWLGGPHATTALITGPNMAGKSTFIRQTALLTVMAQIGSYVPARKARVGVADRIFARVGASDELARGQSTFMVEMTETARILHNATSRSLVVLDEIGRGTSTYDGLSLAWSIVEHLHEQVGCRTLFATHYHELTALAESLPRFKNLNVAVREWEDDVVFLHKIVEGAADKSYGIHVARLAGIPRIVVERAKQLLAQLENEDLDIEGRSRLGKRVRPRADLQLSLFAPPEDPLLDQLRSLDLDQLSPAAAWRLLEQMRSQLLISTEKSKEASRA